MREVILSSGDDIETVLPDIEQAMESGEICRISNIDRLSERSIAVLSRLISAKGLLDAETGKIHRPQPGFGLIGVDAAGVARVLS